MGVLFIYRTKFNLIYFCLLCFTLLVLSSFSVISIEKLNNEKVTRRGAETLWIDADSDIGTLKLDSGFLHGRDEQNANYNDSLIEALKPEEWRLYKYNSYELAKQNYANITYGLSDHYAWYKGGFPNADPWNNWTEYEEFILYVMQYYDYYFPDYPVEYYDIWNEPDHPYFWTGNYNQLLELFYRAYNVVKSYNPDAKVVGPSISWFRPGESGVEGIVDFLLDLDDIYGVRLDAISWHENGGTWYDTRPDGIPTRANYLRQQIQSHFQDYFPELHVNEFMGKQVHLSPGWNVGFLYYLEKAEIDRSMRACWWIYSTNPYDYWCDCWAGLNGLLMKDGETPQPAYWIWLRHVQMENEIKLDVSFSDAYTNVIATRNSSSNIIKLLTGRYMKTSPNDVIVSIVDYSFSQNTLVRIEKVPNDPDFYLDPPIAKPMPEGPELISNEIVEVIDESIQITINDYIDGDAYIITIYPPSSKPEISGPISGKPKTKYDYKFLSESPMESDLYYYIEWGDGNIEDWLGPFSSGEEITISHSWNKKGSYTVQAKVKDTYNLESNWGSLEVSMPKYKILNFHLFNNWFFELLKLCFSPVSRWV
jgi:hypothetical protein